MQVGPATSAKVLLRGRAGTHVVSGSGRGRSAKKRRLRQVIRLTILMYAGLLSFLYIFQSRLIFPGTSTQGHPDAQFRRWAGADLLHLETRSGEQVVAVYGRAQTAAGKPDPAARDRPTMIYFYGNAMCLKEAMPEFDRFRRLGLNVLIPDYVGYGMSGGRPSEHGCQATADAAYDFLVSTRGVDPKTIVSAGWSLGGAVAIDLASRRQVGGLVAFSTLRRR